MTRHLPLILLVFALAGGPLQAQLLADLDPGRAVRTRQDLERVLVEYEAALASPAYSENVKSSIRADADRVRRRLRDGDFAVGDRIEVNVEGEPNFPVQVVVEPGPRITLELFGAIPLSGVLRSELEVHVTEALRRFIRDPVVRATGHMRLSILGSVGNPGFYSLPAETVLGDALMTAGGLGGADMDELRIERGDDVIYSPSEVQEALRRGFTLDQLNLQAGDEIYVPAQQVASGNLLNNTIRILGVVGTLSFLLIRIF